MRTSHMNTEPILITDKSTSRLPYSEVGQYKVLDVELNGFFLKIGKRTKSYMVRGDYWQDGRREFSVQKKVGEFGTVSDERREAKRKKCLPNFPEVSDRKIQTG